jgi:hypothetical protein
MYETCSCQPTYTGGQLEALAIQMLMQLSKQDGLTSDMKVFVLCRQLREKLEMHEFEASKPTYQPSKMSVYWPHVEKLAKVFTHLILHRPVRAQAGPSGISVQCSRVFFYEDMSCITDVVLTFKLSQFYMREQQHAELAPKETLIFRVCRK